MLSHVWHVGGYVGACDMQSELCARCYVNY